MSVCAEFFSSGTFVVSINANFIGPIPKKANAEKMRDFLPIRLVSCVYELLSQVLPCRVRVNYESCELGFRN